MKILNFGSLNIDYVYSVPHFVQPGETLSTTKFQIFAGGKGLNQSIALSRAKAPVFHAGKIGNGGVWLKELLDDVGADTTQVIVDDGGDTGHAIIQVNREGENAIFLFGGTNQTISEKDVDSVLAFFEEGDYLLVQNEISSIGYLIEKASEKGMQIVINPAPMNDKVLEYPLHLVTVFVVNEIEGEQLTGKSDPEDIIEEMRSRYPKAITVLTLGAKGVLYDDGTSRLFAAPPKVDVVDTTAAGDTFIGYLLAGMAEEIEPQRILERSCHASAIAVQRMGAAESIPSLAEVKEFYIK